MGGPRPLLPPAQVPRAHRGSNPNSSMLQRRLCLALPNRQKTAQTLLRYCLRLFPRAASARSHPARTARCTSCGYLLRRSSSKQLPFFFQPTHWNAAFMLPVPDSSPRKRFPWRKIGAVFRENPCLALLVLMRLRLQFGFLTIPARRKRAVIAMEFFRELNPVASHVAVAALAIATW